MTQNNLIKLPRCKEKEVFDQNSLPALTVPTVPNTRACPRIGGVSTGGTAAGLSRKVRPGEGGKAARSWVPVCKWAGAASHQGPAHRVPPGPGAGGGGRRERARGAAGEAGLGAERWGRSARRETGRAARINPFVCSPRPRFLWSHRIHVWN